MLEALICESTVGAEKSVLVLEEVMVLVVLLGVIGFSGTLSGSFATTIWCGGLGFLRFGRGLCSILWLWGGFQRFGCGVEKFGQILN